MPRATDSTDVRSGTAHPAIDAQLGWRDLSACREVRSEMFVSVQVDPTDEQAAKAVCNGCFVADDCLTYAITHDVPFGVWGGLTVPERRRVRREWLASLFS